MIPTPTRPSGDSLQSPSFARGPGTASALGGKTAYTAAPPESRNRFTPSLFPPLPSISSLSMQGPPSDAAVFEPVPTYPPPLHQISRRTPAAHPFRGGASRLQQQPWLCLVSSQCFSRDLDRATSFLPNIEPSSKVPMALKSVNWDGPSHRRDPILGLRHPAQVVGL